MPRTLHLHIGAHRTATTSTQAFLKANFAALQRKGYLHAFNVRRHFQLINQIFSGAADVDEVARDLDARAGSKAHEIGHIILSDEDICMRRDLSVLARFRDHFDVRVIFSLRRQDLWLESWHQQNVKWQWNPDLAHLTFPEFLKRRAEFHWIDYDRTIRHLEALFGAEALRLIVFEKGEMPDGPVAAFCDAIGLTDRAGLAPAAHVNTSLSPLMSEFMRTLPLDEFADADRRLIERACAKADAELRRRTGPQGTLLMDRAAREAVLAGYAEGNAAVARRHFGREALFREPLPDPDAPLAPQRLEGDAYAAIETFVAPLLRALVLVRQEEAEAAAATGPAAGPAAIAGAGRAGKA